MTPVHVLVSARDPGGAAQMRALCPALRADARLRVTVAASGPAFDILHAAGEQPRRFALPDGSAHVPAGGDASALLDAAGRLVDDLAPDVLLVGISSFGVGLDEALLARAGGRPSFALQDYPGDANAVAGHYARTYLVRDEAAARATRARTGAAAIAVGSLRHAAYAGLDVTRLRAATRSRIGAGADRTVVGFFGQPPEIPGHEAALAHLIAALAGWAVRPLVLLREHPKSAGDRARHAAALRRAGLAVHEAFDGDVETWLAACDVVTTPFSHCSMDYAFLDARSPVPLGTVLFLLTTPEISRFFRDGSRLERPDGVDAGLGLIAESPEQVRPLLDAAVTPTERRRFHEASARLPREAGVDVIVDALLAAGRARAAAAP